MSQRMASQSQGNRRAQHRDPSRRPDSSPRRDAASRAGYGIALAGHHIRLGPVAFWIAVGTITIMAGWSVTTATYFAFREDVLKGLLARQAEQQYAYEDRIAELRAHIDRTTSRQLLDQEQFEEKLNELIRRQATLESRASALSGIADLTATGSIRTPMRGSLDLMPVGPGGKPSTLSDSLFAPQPPPDHGKQTSLQSRLGRLEASLDRVERRESVTLGALEGRYEAKARQLHGVLAQLALKLDAAPSATGGPFVPVRPPPQGQDFERALFRASLARSDAERLTATLAAVPIRKPVTGDIDLTSPFGVRMDPFLHEAAMHTGLDFRGAIGEPIHATAAGTVTNAGWSGGYGKMVEIDHGNGLATRYGHLSEIDVGVGDRVRIGQVIGRLGSTGRSTGPHLHYETRVDGEAVDPEKFLNAGASLFGGT
jgi:murein DD-endopeptidase MepM/ murein hydrolase activator NlpD